VPVASRATWSSPIVVGSISVATSDVFCSANRQGPETSGPPPSAIDAGAVAVRSSASGSLADAPDVLALELPALPAAVTSSGDCQDAVAAFQ
jgi:hypothetical protein